MAHNASRATPSRGRGTEVSAALGDGQYLRVGRTARATSAGKTPSEVTIRTGSSLPAMKSFMAFMSWGPSRGLHSTEQFSLPGDHRLECVPDAVNGNDDHVLAWFQTHGLHGFHCADGHVVVMREEHVHLEVFVPRDPGEFAA